MTLPILRLPPTATLPTRGSVHAAGECLCGKPIYGCPICNPLLRKP